MLKFLVAGAGSIARKHICNLNNLGFDDITVVDPDKERCGAIRESFNINSVYNSLEEALTTSDYNAALILTPPALHTAHAIICAEKNLHLFIEKPLSNSLNDIDRLINITEERNLLVYVAYNQRFNEGIMRIKQTVREDTFGRPVFSSAWFGQYLPSWRPWQDYKKSYTANKKDGGGILLDGSHEIDYLLWILEMLPKNTVIRKDKLSGLEIDVEDTVNILMEFPDGSLAHVHLNMIERGYKREVKIISDRGNWVSYDFAATLLKKNIDNIETSEKLDFEIAETYKREIDYFISCINNNIKPSPGLEEAKKLLQVIL